MNQSDDYIVLGRISGVHGVKGWVKVFSHTAPRVKIIGYDHWFLQRNDNDWEKVKIVDGREQGKNIVAWLDGVKDRNQAEALVGAKIAVINEQLKELPKNEYYWRDLIGLAVKTVDDEELGKIDWIFDTGSNDVIVVKNTVKDGNDKKTVEHLIPYIMDDVVKSVDLEKSLMVVDWDPEF